MKLTLLFIALLASFLSYSQDKIILNDGRVKHVKIVKINEAEGNIESTVDGKGMFFPLSIVIEYQFNGVWYTKNIDNKKFEESKSSSYRTYKTFFRTPPSHSYSMYSISATYGQAFGSTTGYNSLYRKYFAANKRVSIEPEARLLSWLSVKVPVVIGFGGETVSDKIGLEGEGQVYTNYFETGSIQYHYGQVHSFRSYNNAVAPTYYNPTGNWYYYNIISSNDIHTKELLYQVGIAPKFFPLGHKKVEFYLSPSINYGIGNYNAVDYYARFESTTFTNSLGDVVNGWKLTGEDMIGRNGEFSYLRIEALTGIDFNLTPQLNFGIEMGFSSIEFMVNNQEQDHIYISTNGGVPVLNTTYDFTPNYNSNRRFKGYFIGRFHLVYKFGGQKIK